jgi:saccharopine dehydrogenase-like NADP-dependent oxidoreductase
MKDNKILIIGSNGILGKYIVEKAIKSFGVENIVLSDYKTKRLAFQKEQINKKFGKHPLTKLIDIHSTESIKKGLDSIDFVIIAIQQNEPLIQKHCIEIEISSIDLSVNPEFIEKTLELNPIIKKQNIQIITGGLFPGLSGILAKEINKKSLPNELVDIGLLQSTNGTNGKTGVSDMLQIFDKDVEFIQQNTTIKYSGFSYKKQFTYPKPFGNKKLRLTNFIERDYLKSKGILSNYWTAFDKESFNRLISILKSIGFLKLFKYPKTRSVLSQLIKKENKEKTNEYIGLSARNSNQEISIILTSDYEATASCVIAFSKTILSNKTKSEGIKFPFELFTFDEIKSDLKDVTIKIKALNN